MKTYTIVYKIGKKQETIECSECSLQMFLDKYIKEKGKIISTIAHKPVIRKVKVKDINIMQKENFYNSKYHFYYKKYKNRLINEKQFCEIKKIIKDLKREYKTREECEIKFEEYKKSTNNILQI